MILSVFNLCHRSHGGIILSNDLMHLPKNFLYSMSNNHVFPPATFMGVNTRTLAAGEVAMTDRNVSGARGAGESAVHGARDSLVERPLYLTGLMAGIKGVPFGYVY